MQTAANNPQRIAVIMAGGLGQRLWPRSRENRPKQFMPMLDENTLLQNTVGRLQPLFQPEHVYIVCPQNFITMAKEQLPVVPDGNFIAEPFGRNTAACIHLAFTTLREKYPPETILCVFPSDHLITNVLHFHNSIQTAIEVAERTDGIVTIGITPTRPEKSFGYIQMDDSKRYKTSTACKAWHVTNFAEKPDVETAQRFIDSGDFLWNTGIFIWKMGVFATLCETYLPEQVHVFKLLQKHRNTPTYPDVLENVYRQIRSISLDYAILEKAENRFVVEADFSWSDVGSWDEVYNLMRKDDSDNAINGNVIAINTRNCFINGANKLIALVGVEDVIVVDSEEALLICHRSESQDVKEIVDFLRRKNIDKHL